MTLYGKGTLCYPGTARVVHDFEDGPFETVDQLIINHALAVGCSDEAPKRGRPPLTESAKQERKGK